MKTPQVYANANKPWSQHSNSVAITTVHCKLFSITADYNEDSESATRGARRGLLSGQPSSSSSLPTYEAVANSEENEWKWDGRR